MTRSTGGFSAVEGLIIVAVVLVIGAVGYVGYTNFIAPPKADVATGQKTSAPAAVAPADNFTAPQINNAKDLDAASKDLDQTSLDDSDMAQLDKDAGTF